jgi:antitoxin component YwqK of YwqJK toxin-antitoxin module
MRKGAFLLASALACAVCGLASGEDRTETISDSKGSKELVYRDDILVEERSYDPRGALIQEKAFDASSLPAETRIYVREGARLVRVDALDASGNPSGSRSYRYDRNGRLLGVDSEGSLGAGSAGMIAAGGTPQGAWISRPKPSSAEGAKAEAGVSTETIVLGYDDEGRATIIQTMRDGAALKIEKRSYGEKGLLASVKLEDKLTGLFSELGYDGRGRLATRLDTPAKGLQVRIEYGYDDSDRLAAELSVQGAHRTAKAYEYSAEGKLAREETRRDGELLLAVSYIENGRIEELYEDGAVFVKATYLGGRKVRDEFYADGEILRARDY